MDNKYEDCIHNRGRKCEALTVKECIHEGCEYSFYMNRQIARMICGNCKHHADGFCMIQEKYTADVKRCNTGEFKEKNSAQA